MRPAVVAFLLLVVVLLAGCADSADLKKARAEAAEAKAELAKVKAELDQLKAQLASKSPANPEAAIIRTVQGFFTDLANGALRGAHDTTSLAYQKRTDLKMFEQFLGTRRALKGAATNISRMDGTACKVRKLAKDNAYECDIASQGFMDPEGVQRINITLRLIEEDGRWKIDDFVEVKNTGPS